MLFKSWRPIVLVLIETSLLLAAVAAGTYVRLGDYGMALLWKTKEVIMASVFSNLPDRSS